MSLTAFVLSSFAPPTRTGFLRPGDAIDWDGSLARFCAGVPLKVRLGVMLGALIAVTAPIWCRGRPRLLPALDPAERGALLEELLRHPVYLVRELMLLLKVCACLALFRAPEIRSRTGYDGPAPASISTPRRAEQRALPVLAIAGAR